MIKLLKPADYITLLNAACGIGSIYLIINGPLILAALLIIAAAFFDWLDGKVARLTKTESELGHDLDSLADSLSFGVAPAVLLISVSSTTFAAIAAVILPLCGILRLARFNVKPAKNGYEGIPITLSALIIAVYFLSGLPQLYLPYLYLLLSVLMISSIKIKKII